MNADASRESRESGSPDTAAPTADTATGPVEPAVEGNPVTAHDEDDTSRLTRELSERTLDLQRLQAEYVNYKRRVDRDRVTVREQATTNTLSALLPVLDDLDRARQHDQLTGGFKAVAESLERIMAGLGLQRFGEPGEPFDPRVHEALLHDYSSDVTTATAQTILQPGYRVGERVVRPARVAVAEPAEQPAPDGAAPDSTAPGAAERAGPEGADPEGAAPEEDTRQRMAPQDPAPEDAGSAGGEPAGGGPQDAESAEAAGQRRATGGDSVPAEQD